eukprot:tig00021238_g19540.t1
MTAPTVERWRARPGEALQSLTFRGHEDDVVAVDVSPDGRWVVSGSTDGSLRLWSVDEVREEKRWVGAHGVKPVYAARFSPDGALIASGGGDGVARLWDAATRAELASFPSATGSAVFAVDVAHAEGARPAALALGTRRGASHSAPRRRPQARRRQGLRRRPRRRPPPRPPAPPAPLWRAHAGRGGAGGGRGAGGAGGDGGRLGRLWGSAWPRARRASSPTAPASAPSPSPPCPPRPPRPPRPALRRRPRRPPAAPRAGRYVLHGGYDGRVLRWERAPGGAPGGALPPPVPFQASQGELNGLAVSQAPPQPRPSSPPRPGLTAGGRGGSGQDGSLLATAGDDRRVRVWERGGRPVRELPRHPDLVYAVALSRVRPPSSLPFGGGRSAGPRRRQGGAVLATACKDRVVRAWLLRPPAPQPGPAPAPSFSFGLAARQAAPPPRPPAPAPPGRRPRRPAGAPGREAAPPEREHRRPSARCARLPVARSPRGELTPLPAARQGGRFLGPPSPGRGDGREPPPLGLLELELGPPRSPSPMSPSYSPTSPGYIPRSPSYAPEPDSPVYAPASPPHLPGSFSPVPESLRRKRKRAPPAAPEADPDAGASSSAHPPQVPPRTHPFLGAASAEARAGRAGGRRRGAGSSSSRAARRAGRPRGCGRPRGSWRRRRGGRGGGGAARGRAERAEAEAAALRAELEAARGEAQRLRAELEAAPGALEERLDGARRRASALRYEAGVREAAAAAAEVATTCVVCLARPREVKVQPCDHASMCEECCERVWSGDRRCPLCRGEITMRSRIRL